MEGACVYINNFNIPTLIMYKEYSNNKVLYVTYNKFTFDFFYISTKQLTNIIPKDSLHILTCLPIDNNSLQNTLNMWKNLALDAILNYHKKREKKYVQSNNDFYNRFKKNS